MYTKVAFTALLAGHGAAAAALFSPVSTTTVTVSGPVATSTHTIYYTPTDYTYLVARDSKTKKEGDKLTSIVPGLASLESKKHHKTDKKHSHKTHKTAGTNPVNGLPVVATHKHHDKPKHTNKPHPKHPATAHEHKYPKVPHASAAHKSIDPVIHITTPSPKLAPSPTSSGGTLTPLPPGPPTSRPTNGEIGREHPEHKTKHHKSEHKTKHQTAEHKTKYHKGH